MTKKRKSVSFREQVSNIYPKSFDGSSSPAAINTAPATAYQSPKLDPKYVTWLRSATKAHYPFIANGTFANHLYLQNFDLHEDMRHPACFQRAEAREAAVPALAEKYGSLGWGSLYAEVTEEAWVKNYRVRATSCSFWRTSLLTAVPGRKSIDSMARMSGYWRRSQRSMMKYVPRKRNVPAVG